VYLIHPSAVFLSPANDPAERKKGAEGREGIDSAQARLFVLPILSKLVKEGGREGKGLQGNERKKKKKRARRLFNPTYNLYCWYFQREQEKKKKKHLKKKEEIGKYCDRAHLHHPRLGCLSKSAAVGLLVKREEEKREGSKQASGG